MCSADCRTQLSTFKMEDQKLSDNSFQLIIAYHAMAVHCHKKHHFLTVPYILFKILTLLRCFIENFHEGILHCRRIATVKRIWVHNILLVEAVDHCSAHCSPAIPPLYHYWLFSVWRLDFICKNYLKAKVMSRSCYSKIKTSSTDLRKGRQSFTSMKRRPICLIWRWHGFQITKNIYQNSACLRVSECPTVLLLSLLSGIKRLPDQNTASWIQDPQGSVNVNMNIK